MNQANLSEALGALLGVLREAKAWRLTARPGRVVVDHLEGARALDVGWSGEQHERALVAVGRAEGSAPIGDDRLPTADGRSPTADSRSPTTDGRSPVADDRLPTAAGLSPIAAHRSPAATRRWPVVDGISCGAIGDAIVLMRGPDANRRIEDLARDGVLSSLAARLLDAAVATGRNVVVAGPWLQAVELISAVVGGAQRPAVVGEQALPLPASWLRLSSIADAVTYGAERVAFWSHDVDALARIMSASSGVVGWLDARRLDRVLVRYEAAIDLRAPRAQAPLQVVAGVDLIVVLQGGGAPRVRELAEITMAADGYRPQLLFAMGMPPSPLALVPLAAPSFIDELAAAGHGMLADELRAVMPRAAPQAADPGQTLVRARAIASQLDEEDVEELPEVPRRVAHRESGHRDPLGIREALRSQGKAAPPHADPPVPEIPRAVVEALRHAPPPGWELDRLGEENWVDEHGGSGNAEDAAMAATFGLAPPPRPAGYKGEAVSFSELLKRARERDPQANEDEQPPVPPEEP